MIEHEEGWKLTRGVWAGTQLFGGLDHNSGQCH